jgi:hypothetical protein
MESEGSLPCSQQPATGPYSDPDPSSLHISPYFPKIRSNIIFQCMPRTSGLSLPLRFADENLCAFLI